MAYNELMTCILVWTAVLYVIAGVFDNYRDVKGKSRFIKPFLMPLLALWYFLACDQVQVPVLLGIFCGWAGDLFLMTKNRTMQKPGILSFLLGRLAYAYMFVHSGIVFHPAAVLVLAGYIVWIVLLFRRLKPASRKDLVVPGFIYGCVILCMSFTAFLNAMHTGSYAGWAGSLLFCVSDSNLALRGCRLTKVNLVMTTYILAQFLIVLYFA